MMVFVAGSTMIPEVNSDLLGMLSFTASSSLVDNSLIVSKYSSQRVQTP